MSSIIKVNTVQDANGNNIINESGNTITIGKANDTVNVVGTLQNNSTSLPGVTFKEGGTNFTNSLLVGTDTTGTLNAAICNTGVGPGVLAALTSGDDNTALGFNAGTSITTASQNVAIGSRALDADTTGLGLSLIHI